MKTRMLPLLVATMSATALLAYLVAPVAQDSAGTTPTTAEPAQADTLTDRDSMFNPQAFNERLLATKSPAEIEALAVSRDAILQPAAYNLLVLAERSAEDIAAMTEVIAAVLEPEKRTEILRLTKPKEELEAETAAVFAALNPDLAWSNRPPLTVEEQAEREASIRQILGPSWAGPSLPSTPQQLEFTTDGGYNETFNRRTFATPGRRPPAQPFPGHDRSWDRLVIPVCLVLVCVGHGHLVAAYHRRERYVVHEPASRGV